MVLSGSIYSILPRLLRNAVSAGALGIVLVLSLGTLILVPELGSRQSDL